MEEKEVFDYCLNCYNKTYLETKERLVNQYLKDNRTERLPESKEKEFETKAQLISIKVTIIEGRKKYPNDIPFLWSCIYKAHLYRKSGIKDPSIVAKAIQAEQSWRSSSGHAFEEMVTELSTLCLHDTKIRYILQKDLNILLKARALANQPTDIAWLEKQVSGDVFDAYVVADIKVFNEDTNEVEEKPICFGCVQCKTSIRDRVSRDVVPSKEAMDGKFWSIGFVLDGTALRSPKYRNMANGNPDSEFKRNGWHGLYVLSMDNDNDRIYGVDLEFDKIRNHTIKAFNAWNSDRMGFSQSWRAEEKRTIGISSEYACYSSDTILNAAEPMADYGK